MENINIRKTGLDIKFSQENNSKLKKAEENLNKYVTDLIKKKEAKLIELNKLNDELIRIQEKIKRIELGFKTIEKFKGREKQKAIIIQKERMQIAKDSLNIIKKSINEVKNEINTINKMLETDKDYLEYKKIKEQIIKETARQLQNLKVEINPEFQKYDLENNNENNILTQENLILEESQKILANSNEKVEEKEIIA